ncbi:MAG: ATP-binding domain-containing protein [Acidimicrobiia bacterium]|nr:ATP-binding domain-containing protein [Acidimicrobiia bacterium]
MNYRTPAEIMAVADLVLAAAAPGVERSRAVRSTGVDPCFERTDPTDVVGAAATRAREAVRGEGTVALVAPEPLHRELVEALADVGAVAGTAEAIDAPVAVLAALDVKGLEFDHVVVVEPARLAPPTAAGLRTLYMVLTRATQRLSVVFSAPLPEALAPPLAATPGAGPRGGTDPA